METSPEKCRIKTENAPLTGRGINANRNLDMFWFSFQLLIWQGCDLNLGIERYLSYLSSG